MAGVKELVAVARAGIENLRATEVWTEIQTRDVLLVDVREQDETSSGAITGAVFAPRGMLEFRADPRSPQHLPRFTPERRVILYSSAGLRSALAGRTLQSLGYTDVAHLEGGLVGWIAAGFTLV